MAEITLTKPEYLAAASLATSHDESKWSINGVFIEPAPQGGVFIVATDKCMMCVFLDEHGKTDGTYAFFVDQSLFNAINIRETEMAGRLVDQKLKVQGNSLSVVSKLVMLPTRPMPSRRTEPLTETVFIQDFVTTGVDYPDWRKVVPDFSQTRELREKTAYKNPVFNPEYLEGFIKILKVAYETDVEQSIRITDKGYCAQLITSSQPDWFGVLMPREGGAPDHLPFSINSREEEKA